MRLAFLASAIACATALAWPFAQPVAMPMGMRLRLPSMMAAEPPDKVGAGPRWVLLQAAVDSASLSLLAFLVAKRDGEFSLEAFLADPATKFTVLGPALLCWGVAIKSIALIDELPNADADPIVRALGGKERVRALSRRMSDAARVRAKE
jgi:hypothetical protein